MPVILRMSIDPLWCFYIVIIAQLVGGVSKYSYFLTQILEEPRVKFEPHRTKIWCDTAIQYLRP